MKWCCPIFEFLADGAGQRGLSVIVATIGSDSFLLQGRAVDAGREVGHTDEIVTVAEQQAIFYCPGCGTPLSQFYADSLDALRREDLCLR